MVYTFACTIGSFVDDDWTLIERVVDFKPLAEREHEGLFGGLAFVKCARERGGLDKMSCFTFSPHFEKKSYLSKCPLYQPYHRQRFC